MMQPPPSPVRDAAMDDANQATQNTQQATQPDSQDGTIDMDEHLWGYLIPCNPRVHRVDFTRVKTEYRLGRDKTNDFVLPGKKVSNFHCEISFKDRTVMVKDKSSNGTYINGEKIGREQFATLKEGSEIAFGTAQPQTENGGAEDYRFIFRNTSSGTPHNGLYASYDLVRELGKGSFATVMQAMSKKNGQFYAVKMIQAHKLRGHYSPSQAAQEGGPTEAAKWGREISIMQELDHINICQLKEVFFEASNINLVLEFVNGGDLLDYILARGGCAEDECRDITSQLCSAMSYIHRKGITHRDLKPENVLMTKDVPPVVKVADFGLAKMVDSYTMLRTMCGTPSYLAPEVVLQVNHEGYQQVVDSWSVGVIVYSMLTNVAPFETQPQDIPVKEQVNTRRVNWTYLTQHHVSPEGVDFIRRLLQTDPARRMKMTVAHTHPWLANHDREAYAARAKTIAAAKAASVGAANGHAARVPQDASMQSAAPDASMEDVSQPQAAPMPGAFDKDAMQPEPSRLYRRSNIITRAQEEPEAGPSIPEPSQEMMQTARAEEDRYYATTSRPNKRKGGPFEGSLTPMPEEEEEGEEAEVAANGIQDLSMQDVSGAPSSSPPTTRSKRAKASPAPVKAPSPPKSQPRGRGGKQRDVGSPAPTEGTPRRSARLHEPSPQKAAPTTRKAGKR